MEMVMTMTMNRVAITQETIDLLKNFAGINSNILIEPGNKIKTISNYKNVMAEATVSETFEQQFGIWDLNKLLGTVALFADPEFEFYDKYMIIHGSNASVTYYYSDPKLLTTINKQINMPESVLSMTFTDSDIKEIHKAASVLQLPDLSISSVGTETMIQIHDRKDPTSNNFSIEKGDNDGKSFDFHFKAENLRFMPGGYDVELCASNVAKFTHQSIDLKYHVALEPDSNYEG